MRVIASCIFSTAQHRCEACMQHSVLSSPLEQGRGYSIPDPSGFESRMEDCVAVNVSEAGGWQSHHACWLGGCAAGRLLFWLLCARRAAMLC